MQPDLGIETIRKICLASKNPLIIASRPIDFDCLGSSLALKWWFYQHAIHANIVSFNKKSDLAKQFPKIEQINFIYPSQSQYDQYDLFVLLDGGDWHQFFTRDWKNIFSWFDQNKMIHIDHHQSGTISTAIQSRSLRKDECCTGKLIYDYFIKYSALAIPPQVATWLYMALVTDTGNFKHLIYKDTFLFAQELFNLGADHRKAIEMTIPKEAVDFTQWAISNTDYEREAQTSVLVIDKEKLNFLDKKFGRARSENNYGEHYKSSFMRLVEGYPYALIFEYAHDQTIKVSWRTKLGSPIAIKDVLKEIGIEAGGHRDAGGGLIRNQEIKEIVSIFLDKMRSKVQIGKTPPL